MNFSVISGSSRLQFMLCMCGESGIFSFYSFSVLGVLACAEREVVISSLVVP